MIPSEQSFELACPHCQKKLKVAERLLGKVVKCAGCNQQFRIGTPNRSASVQQSAPQQSVPQQSAASYTSQADVSIALTSPTQFASGSNSVVKSLPKRPAAVVSHKIIWIAGAGVVLVIVAVFLSAWIRPEDESNNTAGVVWQDVSGPLQSTEATRTSAAMGRQSTTQLPPLPPSRLLASHDVTCYEVGLEWDTKKPMRLIIYVPKGNHKEGTLPCVLEAPAGTNLLHGAGIGTAEDSASYLPFVKEGMVTVTYSIDGHMPYGLNPNGGTRYMKALSKAYQNFIAADAGVKNSQAAIDYVLSRLPMVDREKIYTWGHSSSATLALLLAAKDSRVKRCIAMAPVTNMKTRLGDLLSEPQAVGLFPGIERYLTSGSPDTYCTSLKSKVFLAHARDDDNVPYADSEAFARKHKSEGGDIAFYGIPTGGHYAEMLELSMPEAVQWLKQ